MKIRKISSAFLLIKLFVLVVLVASCNLISTTPSTTSPLQTVAPPNGNNNGVLLIEKLVTASQGVSIASNDGKIALEIPPGALSEDTTVSVRRISEEEWTDDVQGFNLVGPVYKLEPDGLTFEEPVTVKIALDSSLYNVGSEEIEITAPLLYATDSNGQTKLLHDIETVVNPNEAYIQGTTTHFSTVREASGTLLIAMDPKEFEGCNFNFRAHFETWNLAEENLPKGRGQKATYLTDISIGPVAKHDVLVLSQDSIDSFSLSPGESREYSFLYSIGFEEGLYGVVVDYYWAPVDKPEEKHWSVLTVWGKAKCPSDDVAPTTTTTTTTTTTPPTTTQPPTTTPTPPPTATTTTTPPPRSAKIKSLP